MKRFFPLALGIALVAGAALVVLAFSSSNGTKASAGQTASDLHPVWSWTSKPEKGSPSVRYESGSLQGDPGHGYVLVEESGEEPAFFSAPAGTGAFSPVHRYFNSWVLRASDGSLLLVNPGYPALRTAANFTFLGKPLDPAHLGGIGARGVAVPVTWYTAVNKTQTAVVLVDHSDRYANWKLDGYLPGFTLPQSLEKQQSLQRPLLGPDGHLYTIDANGQRLVRQSGRGSSKPVNKHWGCTLWPARDGGVYKACPNSIVLQHADGSSVSVLTRHLPEIKGQVPYRGWYFLQASPNGKWLLLEDAFGACGVATWAEFQQAGGGPLVAAFPDAQSTQALGWLPDNTALVAAQTVGCSGMPVGGIYQVTPGSWEPAPQLVFPAAATFDATTWGFSR